MLFRSDESPFRLRDLLEWAHSKGYLDQASYEQRLQFAHNPARDSQAFGQAASLGIAVPESMLSHLHAIELLDVLLSHARVLVSPDDARSIRQTEIAYGDLDDMWRWNNELLTVLRDDARFDFRAALHHEELLANRADSFVVATAALLLASDLKLPLLADERVCQSLVLGDGGALDRLAFGTDILQIGRAHV